MNNKPETINVNLFDFETLIKETIKNSKKLMEYFRLNFIYYQLISGRGLEFDKIQEYVPGCDPRRIDWKIFARTGKLNIRAYKEERDIDIIIVIDVSNSMLLGTHKYTKNEHAAVIAGILAFAATEAGDNIGGGVYSDKVQLLLDVDREFVHFLNIISKKENYGGKKHWAKLSNDLLANYESDSIIFIISDFLDTNPQSFLPDLASHFSKVYGIMIRDPVDDALPKGVGKMYLKDPNTGRVILTDIDSIREEYEVINKRKIDKIRELFHQYGSLFFKMTTEEDFATGFVKALGGEEVIIS